MEVPDNSEMRSKCDCTSKFHKSSKSLLEKVIMVLVGGVIGFLIKYFLEE